MRFGRVMLATTLAACLLFSALSAMGAESQHITESNLGVTVNTLHVPATAIQIDGHTLVPVRALAAQVGAEVSWVAASNAVQLTKENMTSTLATGSKTATIDGKPVILETAATLYQGHFYASTDFLQQALGLTFHQTDTELQFNGGFAHPLDPLTLDEINTAVSTLKAQNVAGQGTYFVEVSLKEPAKSAVLAYKPGQPITRQAFAVLYNPGQGVTEAVVDLGAQKVVSVQQRPEAQPLVMDVEYNNIPGVIQAHPDFIAAMQRRGIDPTTVQFDIWAPGYFGLQDPAGRRVLNALPLEVGNQANFYSRPIDGVLVTVDSTDPAHPAVLKVVDSGAVAVPANPSSLEPGDNVLRTDVKPLQVIQPAGTNFTIAGHLVKWQHWQFRWSVHPRNGLLLYNVGYEDGGRVRPILYSASLSEMLVPYSDPDWNFRWRNAMDVGEYGLGLYAHQLVPGQHCPTNAVFMDAIIPDNGVPQVMPNAVCIFERDGDVAWAHYESNNGHRNARRAQDLVLRFMAVVGNYDYGIDWIFHQDGTLDQQTRATGILEPKAVDSTTLSDKSAADDTAHGTLVAPHVVAPWHQHFFTYRLDMQVDGTQNSVVESNVSADPASAANPYQGAFSVTQSVLPSELAAQRDLNPATDRTWTVINPNRTDAYGYPVGYRLMPGENSMPYLSASSWARQRAGFVNHQLWVTPYDPTQLYAAGDYPNQSKGGDGLPKWTAANRPVANTDVVLWYTMGLTHMPRPEEWPVMDAHVMGFSLVPDHFFNQNPALDLPDK